MRMDQKVALITGGGSGLGRETAFLFQEEGARVVLLDRVEERAEATAKEIDDRGGQAIAIGGDVASEEDVERAVAAATSSFGRLDVLFANAGHNAITGGKNAIEDVTIDEWNDVLSTNLTGVVLSIKHAVRAMKQRGGSIVVTGSAAAFRAMPDVALYTATKGAVNALVMGLSRELGPHGIRINCINPMQGMSINFMLRRDAPVIGKSYEEAMGDDWDPEAGAAPLVLPNRPTLRDNAKTVLFLASDDSGHMTGQSLISNDGGILSNTAINFVDGWDDAMRAPYREWA